MAAEETKTEPLITKRSHRLDEKGLHEHSETILFSFGSQTNEGLATEGDLLDMQTKSKTWDEVRKQLYLAGPMIGVNVLQSSIQLVSLMFVGHLGELSLASASIALSFANVSGFSVLLGMGSALETLCGQAYGGKQFYLLGVYMQRALIVLNLAAILISFVWFNMGKILVMLHQDAAIAAKAGEFARWLIPGLFAYASLQALVKFLQTQAVVLPMLLCAFITLLVHIPVSYVLIFNFDIGNIGAALASSLSSWLNVALLLLYIRFSKTCSKTWTSYSREAFHDLKGFLKLAIPSAVMVCLEWWAFELALLLSGMLPNPQLETSALSICFNTIALAFMIPFGLSAAVSTRVSNELGAGRPIAAQFVVRVALSLAVVQAMFVASLLLSIRHIWGWAFSNEAKMVRYVAAMIPLFACIAVMDGMQGVLSGIARGCGWQVVGAFTNLAAYYIVGFPITILLGFVFHLSGQGLWIGVLCGVSTQMVSLLVITLRLNWETQVSSFNGFNVCTSIL
ncbi:hypothetical protein O6H91_15G017100 [Diphasiastrum complanatum]|uniref:Uncharacterized protein n=1 Tax=Diphasiastrum complanatum TaxID=34168 RepID=A0ACC2BG83_DIPCM|nr:hypothetical protein O6H91_15G017100 [Diphasiastrum complanatum]